MYDVKIAIDGPMKLMHEDYESMRQKAIEKIRNMTFGDCPVILPGDKFRIIFTTQFGDSPKVACAATEGMLPPCHLEKGHGGHHLSLNVWPNTDRTSIHEA